MGKQGLWNSFRRVYGNWTLPFISGTLDCQASVRNTACPHEFLPRTYILSTQAGEVEKTLEWQWFMEDFQWEATSKSWQCVAEEEEGCIHLPNLWIVKPATGARGVDIQLFDNIV